MLPTNYSYTFKKIDVIKLKVIEGEEKEKGRYIDIDRYISVVYLSLSSFIFGTQLNVFKYFDQTLIILFAINHLFAHS